MFEARSIMEVLQTVLRYTKSAESEDRLRLCVAIGVGALCIGNGIGV